MSQNEHTPNGRMQTLRTSCIRIVCGSAYAKRSLGLHIATTVTVIIIATICYRITAANTNIIMELNEHIEILHSHQQVDKKHTNAHRHTKQVHFLIVVFGNRSGLGLIER